MSDIRNTFDRDTLARVCSMREREFGHAYDLQAFKIDQPAPENFYFYGDHGSNVLAVAHLDTVGGASERDAHFLETEGGLVVYSRALDDRLGAYIILEWLPALGIQYDILLTVGEESGMSTAAGFTPPPGKRYDWMIEFDRGGTDVVMYQYDDKMTREAVKLSGARVGDGIFSDICYLEHLGVKGFNWGVGYQDYHGPRAHAYLEDTYKMLDHYLDFHDDNTGVHMPHDSAPADSWANYGYGYAEDDEEDGFTWDRDGMLVDTREPRLDDDWIEWPTNDQMRRYEETGEAAGARGAWEY